MAQRPLLFFPNVEVATRNKLGSGGGKFSYPSTERQGERFFHFTSSKFIDDTIAF